MSKGMYTQLHCTHTIPTPTPGHYRFMAFQYYLEDIRPSLLTSIHIAIIMGSFAGIFHDQRQDPRVRSAYDWVLRALACVLTVTGSRVLRGLLVRRFALGYKRQTYMDNMRDILQMQYVMTRLYERAIGECLKTREKVSRLGWWPIFFLKVAWVGTLIESNRIERHFSPLLTQLPITSHHRRSLRPGPPATSSSPKNASAGTASGPNAAASLPSVSPSRAFASAPSRASAPLSFGKAWPRGRGEGCRELRQRRAPRAFRIRRRIGGEGRCLGSR